MNELKVFNFNQVDVVDSLEVARFVERNHKELLRDIHRYIEIMEKSNERKFAPVEFFIPSTYKDGKGETRPCYLLTKKGCDMVANKMTGEKGVLFTAAYVTAFEKMREKLSQGAQAQLTVLAQSQAALMQALAEQSKAQAQLTALAQSQAALMQALAEQSKAQAGLAEAVKALAGKVEELEDNRPAVVYPKDPPMVSLTGLAKVIINTRRILLDQGSSPEDVWKVTRSILNTCGFCLPEFGRFSLQLEDFF